MRGGSSGRVSAGCLAVLGFGVVAAGLLLLTRTSEPPSWAPQAPLHYHEAVRPAVWSRTGAQSLVEEYDGPYDGDRVRLPAVQVSVNTMGLREREVPFLKAPGVFRLLALGDELTFGHGIAEPDTWPRRLQAALAERAPADREIEVLNAGQPGASLANEIEMLEARWLGYRPDRILLAVNADDGEDRRVRDELEQARLAELAPAGAEPAVEQRWQAREAAWAEADRRLAAEAFETVWGRFEENLATLDRLARLERTGVSLVLLDGAPPLSEQLAGAAATYGWEFIDLGGIMRAARNRGELLHFRDLRPNARAHAEIARRLADALAPHILPPAAGLESRPAGS